MDTPCRLSLLGAEVDVVTPALVLDFIASRATAGRRGIVANHNLHSLYLYAQREDMHAFYARADLIEIDSTPMIAWARLMGLKVSRDHRCTYLDFRDDFWTMVRAKGLSVYFVGGTAEVCRTARAAILSRYPGVRLDTHSGFFELKGKSNEAVLADIAMKHPDVLLVGMGMPRQELWILDNLARLPACVILPVGGAFDYEAGAQYMPPRWTGRLGLEWLARFMADPQRLFERYFIEPWALMPQMINDVTLAVAGLERRVARPPLDVAQPWQRRQALSHDTPLPEPAPITEPETAPAEKKPRRSSASGRS